MEPNKPTLPPWMPWAATACLAAAVACVGSLLAVEREKGRIRADELTLSRDALRAAQNQLTAERIVARREIADLAARVGETQSAGVVLLPPESSPVDPAPIAVASVLPGRRAVGVLIYRLPPQDPGHDYQLWVDGGAGCVAGSEAFHASGAERQRTCRIELPIGAPPQSRFLLIDGRKGGFPSLSEALASGSIVLASTGPSPSISK